MDRWIDGLVLLFFYAYTLLYFCFIGEVAERSIAQVLKTCGVYSPRGFESHPLRQLGNEVIGSPSARARQPILSANWNFLSFKMKFEPIFLRKSRILSGFSCKAIISAYSMVW